ncbi:MAG: 4Fe-4S dicluster domain-containing protein [Candidatus Thermoplasmatota archaeon]|nr:4Fe-4S dicluster domain-containing protein [Candidatus Thermoplasmatota archaeon]
MGSEICVTDEMVEVFIMGKPYEVPSSLTIMKAMEYAGYKLVRGVGCREGFCGACGTVFRRRGDYKLYSGLACQTLVEDGMYLAQIPAFPAEKAVYDIRKLEPTASSLLTYYPELARCVSCNSCTKVCPQEIQVMDYVNEALRGDIERAAHTSFDCIMCGLCTARCHAEMPQYLIGILARRLYAAHIAAKAPDLEPRVQQILDGEFDEELEGLKKMSVEELKDLYKKRDIEPT